MSKAKDTLEIIGQYYGTVRRVGHTHTAIEGLKESEKAIFVVGSLASGMHFKNRLPEGVKTISINSIVPALHGRNLPMVFDNEATFQLCTMALNEINDLEEIVDDYHLKIRSLEESIKERDKDLLDLIDAMLKTINGELFDHEMAQQNCLRHSEEYSYKSVVKDRISGNSSNNNEKEALWYDGASAGRGEAVYSLRKLKNNLHIVKEAALKAACNFDKRK
jgi:hypothetical protein